ncbi:hypothetical protein E2C01_067832 [Portunus trituberculatus]|uniref:Uncharacterized protein n=1 Tax=Portunus trituberculatus TaxID=210409 RepID=A0A5B7HM43_PORTR|nr:hypothetical protein [Portunus trituberculatus]
MFQRGRRHSFRGRVSPVSPAANKSGRVFGCPAPRVFLSTSSTMRCTSYLVDSFGMAQGHNASFSTSKKLECITAYFHAFPIPFSASQHHVIL